MPSGIILVRCFFVLLSIFASGLASATDATKTSTFTPRPDSEPALKVAQGGSSHDGLVCAFGNGPISLSTARSTRLEAENYDTCVESYFDTTPEKSGTPYRDDGVEIRAKATYSNGFAVTAVETVEYLEYSIVVPTSGLYKLRASVLPSLDLSRSDAVFALSVGGERILGATFQVPANSAGEWQTVSLGDIYLSDGPQTLRLTAVAGGASLDFIEFEYGEALAVSAKKAVSSMRVGINLGNTLDAPKFEGAWAPPAKREYLIDFVNEGFAHIRIPVNWGWHTEDEAPYLVDPKRMNRVEQVIDWALEQGVFVILNMHHEKWIKNNYGDENIRKRFEAIWRQILERFQNKSSRLIFEILNEPKKMSVAEVDDANKRILSMIREVNPSRLVVFSGNGYAGVSSLLKAAIPNKSDKYLIGNFHSYDPWKFAGKCARGWGTQEDMDTLEAMYDRVANWSKMNDIPVTLNEFGATKYDYHAPHNVCTLKDRLAYLGAHVRFAKERGIALTFWDDDDPFATYDRATNTFGPETEVLLQYNP